MASSIINFFKKKHNNRQGGYELDEPQKMHCGRHATASFRIPLYKKNSPPECVAEGSNGGGVGGGDDRINYKSPYDVVTEPKKKRAIRSCPGGNAVEYSTSGGGKFAAKAKRKFSPKSSAILENSGGDGSYENFPVLVGSENMAEPKNIGTNGSMVGGMVPLRWSCRTQNNGANANISAAADQHNSPNRISQQYATIGHGQQQQHQPQISTSEYGSGSTEPSPVNEQQPTTNQAPYLVAPYKNVVVPSSSAAYYGHRRRPPCPLGYGNGNGCGGDGATRGGGGNLALARFSDDEEEEEDDDEDDSSAEEDRLSASFLQFWQHQVKILKKEVRTYREAAEKYRTKYIRVKSRAEELSMELTRERERNISLFNQLLIANDKIVQLAQFHSNQQQKMAPTAGTSAMAGGMIGTNNNPSGFGGAGRQMNVGLAHHHQQTYAPTSGGPLPQLLPQRPPYGAGESQCPAKEIHGYNSSAGSESELLLLDSFRHNKNDGTNRKGQQQGEEEERGNFGHFRQNGRPPLFDSSFLNFSLLSGGGGLEVPRNAGRQQNSSGSNYCCFSPHGAMADVGGKETMAMASDNISNDGQHQHSFDDDSPIKLDLTKIQQQARQEDDDEEDTSPIFLANLDKCSIKTRLGGRLSLSLDDVSGIPMRKKDKSNISLLSSSDDDVAKLWTKQLIKKGDRIVFRPPRKSLFAGLNDEKDTAPLRLFKRFGKSEREAMSKFDYLEDEKSDVSGLNSSPEKVRTTKEN